MSEHIETLVSSKDYSKLEAENAALREENRKLRDAWPTCANGHLMPHEKTGGVIWCVLSGTAPGWYARRHGDNIATGPLEARDAAINAAAGITKGGE